MGTIQNKDDYAIVLSYGQLEKPQKYICLKHQIITSE